MSGCDTLIVENGYYYDNVKMPSNTAGNVGGSGCYTTIEAATPWGVTIDSSHVTPSPNAVIFISQPYIQIIGIKAASNPNDPGAGGANYPWMVINTNHVKLQQTAGYNAPCAITNGSNWNMDVYAIGPGSSYVLVEDSHAWGCGRYKFMAYQSDHVIFRRDVARHDFAGNGMTTGSQAPMLAPMQQCGDFVNYDGHYDIFQNDIAIDSGLATGETGNLYGGLWSEHNDSSTDNPIIYEGGVVINVQANAGLQDAKQSSVHTFIDDAVVNSSGGLMIGRPFYGGNPDGPTAPTVSVTHMTFANISGQAPNDENGGGGTGIEGTSDLSTYASQTVANNIFQNMSVFAVANSVTPNYNYYYQNTANFGSDVYQGYMPTAGANDAQGVSPQLKYITREEPGTPVYGTASDGGNIGATILYEIGTTGTLYGDPGYDTVTTTSLWPFPNEAVIKSDMATFSMVNPITGNTISGTRGFAASGNGLYGGPITLTSYIWEALGNPCPAGICP